MIVAPESQLDLVLSDDIGEIFINKMGTPPGFANLVSFLAIMVMTHEVADEAKMLRIRGIHLTTIAKNLYNANVRKVVVMGLDPIGCAPYYLWLYHSKNGQCVETINDMILEFNFAVRYIVAELNEELVGATVIFCDAFEGSMDIIQNHDRYGFNVTDEACCGLGKYKGWILCISPEMACSNASNHIWWDQFYPTDAVNAILADNVWSGLHTPLCYPMKLQDMLAPSTR